MRVLFVSNMWPDDVRPWYGSFVHSQANSLAALGVDISVLSIRGYASTWEYPRAAVRVLASNLRRFDVVHAHYGHSGVIGRLNVHRPLVVSYCGDDLLGTPDASRAGKRTPRSLALARAFAQLARVSAATITKSLEMERRLPEHVRPRNHVIPNGVDLERFAPIDQGDARRRLGWSRDEKIALFVGNPALTGKNYPLAEAACAIARRDCPELRLRPVWKLPPDEMPTCLSAADTLVFPSLSEGSPNAVKEAMACELPIVATSVGDVSERLAGVSGCAVVPPEPSAFAAALLAALRHGRSLDARRAVSALSSQRVAERILDVYRSVSDG
jgi:teichuronic acid biosynthesis glycosyltransferase TuaC